MAYEKKKIFAQAKEVIVKHKLFFMDEVPDFLPCGRPTFYKMFPDGSDELDTLKGIMCKVKTEIKTSMRSKWYKSPAPALQLALMKLLSTEEELRKLSMTHTDITTKGEAIDMPVPVFTLNK